MKTLSQNSVQPLLAEAVNMVRFIGRYYLYDFEANVCNSGQEYWLLTLADASGELQVYCNSAELMQKTPEVGQFIHVEASFSRRELNAYFRCKNLLLDVPVGPDLSSLPRIACPIENAFDALFFIVSRIENNNLREFTRDVLLQPDVAFNYFSCTAGLTHHHNYAEGLLVHSLEMAWQKFSSEEQSGIERDIAVVVALFHDVGKVRTLKPQFSRIPVGSSVREDYLTLEVCSNPMKKLSETAPKLANQLHRALKCNSSKARHSFKPQTQVAKHHQPEENSSASIEELESLLPRFCLA